MRYNYDGKVNAVATSNAASPQLMNVATDARARATLSRGGVPFRLSFLSPLSFPSVSLVLAISGSFPDTPRTSVPVLVWIRR